MDEFRDKIDRLNEANHEYELSIRNLKRAMKRKDKAEKVVLELQKEVDGVQNKLDVVENALDGMRDVQGYTIADLFNPDFLGKHTDYTDCDEFFGDSGITPDQLLHYQKYPKIANKIAKDMTDFDNFDDFVKEAVLEYNLKNHGINEIPDFVRNGTNLKFKK